MKTQAAYNLCLYMQVTYLLQNSVKVGVADPSHLDVDSDPDPVIQSWEQWIRVRIHLWKKWIRIHFGPGSGSENLFFDYDFFLLVPEINNLEHYDLHYCVGKRTEHSFKHCQTRVEKLDVGEGVVGGQGLPQLSHHSLGNKASVGFPVVQGDKR